MEKVDYVRSYRNNFKNDVNAAVKFYLNIGDGTYDETAEYGEGFILYPQALNPFLKIMETMKESKKIMILPAFKDYDKTNDPAYLILKLPESSYVNNFELSK